MKKVIITLVSVLFALLAYGQDTSKNYIKTYTARNELKDSLTGKDKYLVQQSVQYVDGLGRPVQAIARWASPDFRDVVSFMTYDEYGRQTKQYLPYESDQNDLSYRTAPLSDQNTFYDNLYGGNSGDYAFSQSLLEYSPLNRVKKQAAPGYEWRITGDHTVDMYYLHNDSLDHVQLIRVLPDQSISAVAEYGSGQLSVTKTTDENDSQTNQGETREFSNKTGQVVMKEVRSSSTEFYRTYYVYDDFGNLRYVVPPEAIVRIEAANDNWSLLQDSIFQANWLFSYQYDGRKRMTGKRVPGADWVYMVYDPKDRLILTQDGNQRAGQVTNVIDTLSVDRYQGKNYQLATGAKVNFKKGFRYSFSTGKEFRAGFNPASHTKTWIFTKYDKLNRPVATGFYTSNLDRESLQAIADSASVLDESYSGTGIIEGYTNISFPQNINQSDLLSITYYDDYDFNNESIPAGGDAAVLGQVTGSKTRIMLTGDWLETITFYDDRYRPVKIVTDNHKSGKDIIENYYRNKVSSLITHTVMTHSSEDYTGFLTVVDSFFYDHMDRLLKQTQSVNGGSSVTIAENDYNGIGELISKEIGNNVQKVDYEYNIRGWLTKINGGTTLTGNDKFGMELQYDVAGQYNGNIGRMKWRSTDVANSGANNNTNTDEQSFDYTYDRLSRLKTAIYSSTGKVAGAYNVAGNDNGIAYDANGNILNLFRYKQKFSDTQRHLIDNLNYEYANGNQLSRVIDNGTSNAADGFKDGSNTGDDYTYDANGNMISDENKSITWIGYNHLNLPEEVQFANGNYVKYLYDAAGIKLQKEAKIEGNVKVTDYIGGKHYVNGTLEFFQHSEGRVLYDNGSFNYEYNLTDHLGNVRVTLNQAGTVIQKDDYYPFGLTFNSWTDVIPENQYKYNGIEEEKEWSSYLADFRSYDPVLSRWMQIDPKTSERESGYVGFGNNPMIYADPLGDTVRAVNESSASQLLNTIQNSFKGDNAAGLRSLFSLGEDGLTMNSIGTVDLVLALAGLSEDQQKLALGYASAINNSAVHEVEFVSGDESLSASTTSQLQKSNSSKERNIKKGSDIVGGGFNFSLNGNRSKNTTVIVTSPQKTPAYVGSGGKSAVGNHTVGESLAHELIGHGLGRLGNYHDPSDAVKVSNIYLRAQGVTDYYRDGSDHGETMGYKRANGTPNYVQFPGLLRIINYKISPFLHPRDR
ncbi:MAG: DUF6443 domain-containing protein [Cyclobacteriaceae bacterium]